LVDKDQAITNKTSTKLGLLTKDTGFLVLLTKNTGFLLHKIGLVG